MSGYRTWQDFDDKASKATGDRTAVIPDVGALASRGSADELDALGVAPELVELLRRKEQLEAQLRQFAEGDGTPDDERRAKCFPVKVHTKETRIEERRLRRRDELLALLNQRSLERAHLARVRTELERQVRLRQLELALRARIESEQQAQAQRRALEHATLVRRRNVEAEESRDQARQEAERRSRADALAAARHDRQVAEDARLAEERELLLLRWATRQRRWHCVDVETTTCCTWRQPIGWR